MARVVKYQIPVEFRGRRHMAHYTRDGRLAIEAGIVRAEEGSDLDAKQYAEFRRLVLKRVAQIERGDG